MKIAKPEWDKSLRGQHTVCCYGESGRSSVRWQRETAGHEWRMQRRDRLTSETQSTARPGGVCGYSGESKKHGGAQVFWSRCECGVQNN